jgi:O-antigen ligase
MSLLAVPLIGVFSGGHVRIFSLPLYAQEILTVSALATLIPIRKSFLKGISPRHDILFFALLLIAMGVLLSAMTHDMTLHGYGRIKSWFFFPLLYGSILIFALKKKMLSISDTLRSVFLGGIAMGISAIVSSILGEGISYDHRLHGFLPSPNHLAMFLGTAILGGFFLIQSPDVIRKKERLPALLGMVFLGVLLLFTQSYAVLFSVTGILCIGVFLSRYSFSRKQFVALFLGCALGTGALFLLSGGKWQSITSFDGRSSLASRNMIWHVAFRMIEENPLTGIGPGNFQTEYLRYQQYFPPYLEWSAPHPHNSFLDLWLEGGIFGVSGIALLTWCWLSSAGRYFWQKKNESSWYALPFLLGLYFFLIGLTDVPFLRNDLAYLFATALIVSRYELTSGSDRSSHHGD